MFVYVHYYMLNCTFYKTGVAAHIFVQGWYTLEQDHDKNYNSHGSPPNKQGNS